jgi:hypothetical protein
MFDRKLLIMLAIAFLICSQVGCNTTKMIESVTEKKTEPVEADSIRKDFAKSPDALYAKHHGKEISVKGKVVSNQTIFDEVLVRLGSSDGGADLDGVDYIECKGSIRESQTFSGVKAGDDITINGYFFVYDDGKPLVVIGCRKDTPDSKPSLAMKDVLKAETIMQEYQASPDAVYAKYQGNEVVIKGKVTGKNEQKLPNPERYQIRYPIGSSKETMPILCEVDQPNWKSFPENPSDEITVKGVFFVTGDKRMRIKSCQISK